MSCSEAFFGEAQGGNVGDLICNSEAHFFRLTGSNDSLLPFPVAARGLQPAVFCPTCRRNHKVADAVPNAALIPERRLGATVNERSTQTVALPGANQVFPAIVFWKTTADECAVLTYQSLRPSSVSISGTWDIFKSE